MITEKRVNAIVALVPVGSVPEELLTWLPEQLGEVLGVEAFVSDEIPLPAEAFEPRRRQYQGSQILATLRLLGLPRADRVVGLVDVDSYARGLNFIFGQAAMRGHEAFVALPRLRPSFYGHPESVERFYERVLKEVVHELGHTWGLSHCPDPRCVMHFSNTLRDTDVKGVSLCDRCQAKLN